MKTVFLSALLMSSLAGATGVATAGISYEGQIIKPDGSPLAGTNAQFKIQIRTPDSGSCLLYEETQTLNMSGSGGSFALSINDGTGTRTDSTNLTLDRIFANRGSFALNPTTCLSGSGTYAPNANDGRSLVVQFKDETMGTWESIPAEKINFVPLAIEAKQIAGFTADSLLRVINGSGDPLTGVAPLSNAQYTTLLQLANGTSTQYAQSGTLNGAALPMMSSGQVLGWNGTTWVSTSPAPAAASVTGAMIANGAIAQSNIANGAVSTAQIDGAVSINTSGTIGSAIATTRQLNIYAASPSTFSVGMVAPALTSSYSLIWPLNTGSPGQVLTTNGSGVLSWAAAGGTSQWNTNGSNINYVAGYVGIGTTAPASALDVVGDIHGSGLIYTSALGSAATPSLKISGVGGIYGIAANTLGIATSGVEQMRFDPSGHIGIGVTAPSASLHLKTGAAAAGGAPLKFNSGSLVTTPEDGAMEYNGSSLYFTIGSTRYVIPTNTSMGNYSNVSTIGNTSGSVTMTPMSGNSVIVNGSTVSTSSSTGALIVNGGAGVAGAVNASGNVASGGTVTAANGVYTPLLAGGTMASGNLKIDSTDNSTKGIIAIAPSGGNVGIGTTAPMSTLDVSGNYLLMGSDSGTTSRSTNMPKVGSLMTPDYTAANPWAMISGSSQPSANVLRVGGSSSGFGATQISIFTATSTTVASSVERLRIDTTGNVGIGTTSPRARLDVAGAIVGGSVLSNTTSFDYSLGNVLYTTQSCAAFQLNNLKDGGTYKLIVKNTTSATCSFTAYSDVGSTVLTVHLPTSFAATTSGKHTLFEFTVGGSDVYVQESLGY